MNWAVLIGLVALAFAIVSFALYVIDAMRKPPATEDIVQKAAVRAAAVDVGKLADFAKGLADAFSKVGPGLVALIGAILFLLLSGEALGVYKLTGPTTTTPATKGGNAETGSAGNDSAANSSVTTSSN